jgi:imidazole glycerol-phosphate synthase subunit HisH
MIAIIKYNAGNIESVKNAINGLGFECIVTNNHKEISTADKVIFPGVGEASSAMNCLEEEGLIDVIKSLKQPVLGICLGMQLLCSHSEEGDTKGMEIFSTQVKKFPPTDKVPHMGWNNFTEVKGELFQGIETENDMYFVHGFYAEVCSETIAFSDYINPFSSALNKDNFYGVQFHPEKSADVGEKLLKNFLEL